MKKKISALILVILMIITFIPLNKPVTVLKAAQKITVNLHYQRSDQNYEGWNIWSWADGTDGKSFNFTKDDTFGKVASYSLSVPDGVQKIGFIIRKSDSTNEWAAKDGEQDRFALLSNAQNNVLDIYVVSGQAEFGYSETDVFATKITKAKIIDKKTIEFELSSTPNKKDYKSSTVVKDLKGNEYAIESVQLNKTTGIVTLKDSIELSGKYTLSIKGFNQIDVTSINLFSTKQFEDEFTYGGTDLGFTWTKEKTTFKVWAPTATRLSVNLYTGGDDSIQDKLESFDMKKGEKGVWTAEKTGDLSGTYYTYSVTVNGTEQETVDPYAKSAGVNGNRSMIIDLSSTNPDGWENDNRVPLANPTDATIYELHIRDLSSDSSSGIQNTGKFLGLTETGTKNKNGNSTGLDHIKNLGVTHIQVLPCYDYATVDESKPDSNQFNWGYDPKNYNVPEGSYSTDATNGTVRVNEYKQMVQALHKNNIGIIMDVVYNHTYSTDFCFNQLVPDYFYRIKEDGTYSNGSGCGNDVATERSMVRKYIVDSVVYWASEYHIDGFRFDLVGLIDVETIKQIRTELDKIDPNILLYGEGWSMQTAVTKENTLLATQKNASLLPGFGFFSDNIRDGLKGSVFRATEKGYVTGAPGKTDLIKSCIVGTKAWAPNPSQVINYTSCHDNNTLWDRIALSNASDSEEDRIKYNLLCASIVYTSQGIPFIQAGEEFLRSKQKSDGTFDSNSYKSSDSVNSLKWDSLDSYNHVTDYYKGLIEFRKNHAALRQMTAATVEDTIQFVDDTDENVIAYSIKGKTNGEIADSLFIIYNPNKEATTVTLPAGDWKVCVNDKKAGTEVLETVSKTTTVNPISCMVLVQGETKLKETTPTPSVMPTKESTPTSSVTPKDSNEKTPFILYICIGSVAAICIVGSILFFKKKK